MVSTLKNTAALMALALVAISCKPIKPTGDVSDIRGRVFSRFYNGPVQNATIEIPALSTSVKTDINGYFELRGMPTKWMDATLTHQTHKTLKRPIHVEPYGTKYVEFWMDTTTPPAAETRSVVFERNFDIWVSDEYGMVQKNITGNMPRNFYRTYPTWSTRKDKIGFISYDSSQRLSIQDGVWVMRSDGTMPRIVTPAKDIGRLYYLDWSRSGQDFVFMLQNRMFVYDQNAAQLTGMTSQLTRNGNFTNYTPDSGPVFTPDNQKIIYTDSAVDLSINYRNSPTRRQIFIMDRDGSHRRQLTFGNDDNYAPAVSHDGKQIAYVSLVSGKAELWVMDIDGSNPLQITRLNATQMSQPRWSMDDQSLLFSSNYMQTYKSLHPKELWRIQSDGSNLRMITNDAQHADG